MKTAKEMFEELGYKQTKERNNIKYYKNGKCMTFMDGFDNKQTVWGTPQILEIQEHQAIHQQMKELNWID